ncbi:MAG: NADH-quinone oxidoreductase subunit NuoH [Armatimonadetes bacterium]|nr:NADH-quinone oxidoreductase subunit NuoH [Armatimonadota bacterium]
MNWLIEIGKAAALCVVVFTFIAISVMVMVYAERKLSAWMQARIGPRHVGPQGLLQLIADTVKLLQKENIVPRQADYLVFSTAPLIVAVAALLDYVVIPLGKVGDTVLIVRDINIGVLYFAAMASLTVIGILTGGWASNNKYSLLGGLRSAAQMVSYEIPLGLSIICVAMLASTLSTVGIVEAQRGRWFIFQAFPFGFFAFVVFIIASTAETNRVPFDLPEAESELIAGYQSEYTGMRFSLFQLGEYGELFGMSAMAVVMFLGGWSGPRPVPPLLWFFIKTYALVFVMIWVRWTYPRFRIDQLLNLSWKFLLPVGLVNILGIGAWLILLR